MPYQLILEKDIKLDAKLLYNKEQLSSDDIQEYLNELSQLSGYVKDWNDLQRILVLIRKWKLVLYEKYEIIYYESNQSNIAKNLAKAIEIRHSGSKKSLKLSTAAVKKQFSLITESVDPYTSFSTHGLAKIDPVFYKHYTSLDIVKQASLAFKSGDLENSYSFYLKVLEVTLNNNKPDDIEVFLAAWAYHGIANIEYLLDSYDKALGYYQNSLDLKKQLTSIPELNNKASEAKLLYCKVNRLGKKEWNKELDQFLAILKNNYKLEKENKIWYNNIIEDVNHQLAKSYIMLKDYGKAGESIDNALKIGKKFEDKIGLLKSYILLGMITTEYSKSIEIIVDLLNDFDDKHRINPNTRKLVTKNFLEEVERYNSSFATELKSILISNSILPLELP